MIILADSVHPPENIRKMGTKCAPVTVQFIDHNISQICKDKVKPILTVIRKKCRVQHFRIR